MNEKSDWPDANLPELRPELVARIISRAKEQKRLEMQGRRIVKRAGMILILLAIVVLLVNRSSAQVMSMIAPVAATEARHPMSEDRAAGRGKEDESAWREIVRKYPVGTHVQGTVLAITESGFLIGIEEGVAGLIAFSDPSLTKLVNPTKILEVGDGVDAIVSELDMDQRRMSLSLRRVDP